PDADATITAERQLADGSYEPTDGDVEEFATEAGEHWYQLSYDAADRPEADGTIRYRFTAGAVTRYLFLHQFSAGAGEDGDIDSAQIVADILAGLASVSITRIGPEFDPQTKTITLIAGDDYLAANSNAMQFAVTLPGVDLTGAVAVFSAEK